MHHKRGECKTRMTTVPDGLPVCDATSGACVECAKDTDCPDKTKPICGTDKTCRRCNLDGECVAKSLNGGAAGPGVCMDHDDGRCATNDETIYVDATSTSCSSAGGTTAAPFCTLPQGIGAVTSTRRLIVASGGLSAFTYANMPSGLSLTIVGKSNASINGGTSAGITLSAGQLFVRDVTIAGGAAEGIVAQAGTLLYLRHVKVDSNALGGIRLTGAQFNLKDVLVSRNGGVGGIYVSAPTGMKLLDTLSVVDNLTNGISCTDGIGGTGVYANNNAGTNVLAACGIMPCSPPVGGTCIHLAVSPGVLPSPVIRAAVFLIWLFAAACSEPLKYVPPDAGSDLATASDALGAPTNDAAPRATPKGTREEPRGRRGR